MQTDVVAVGPEISDKIKSLTGPILVLGASGFVGANLFRRLLSVRGDVFGTAAHLPAWRLLDIPAQHVVHVDLLDNHACTQLLAESRPQTVFDCISYGAYPFETEHERIYQTNFLFCARLAAALVDLHISAYVHAGSSSEYGYAACAPTESALPRPNSVYSVSKVACAQLLSFYGTNRHLPCVNLRLYSVYGPLEDAERLIPALIRHGLAGGYPPLVAPNISRDFVYVEDVCEAFLDAAIRIRPSIYGRSFNVGTGKPTTIAEIAALAAKVFELSVRPTFTMPPRDWDVEDWYANVDAAGRDLGWSSRIDLETGLRRTAAWYQALTDQDGYVRSSKKHHQATEATPPGTGMTAGQREPGHGHIAGTARTIRRVIVDQARRANVGHIGSALSIADIITALYFSVLRIPSPKDRERDRFVLSKGHAALALYAALYLNGSVTQAELDSYCSDGSLLGVHPDHHLPGIDFSTGSLGHGLSIGAGSALGARMQSSVRRTFVLLSDAECNEGSTWEAAMFAAQHRLSNLVAIVDNNGQQALGYTKDVLDLEPLEKRWEAFGWKAMDIDGHDSCQLAREIALLDTESPGAPHVFVARTISGKGISFMEKSIKWHYWPMSNDEYRQACSELARADA